MRFRLTEDDSSIQPRDLTARIKLLVTDTPPQGAGTGDLDLCIYQAGGGLVGCSSNNGVEDEMFEVRNTDTVGQEDDRDVWIRVKGVASQVNSYQLQIDGFPSTPVTVEDNLD